MRRALTAPPGGRRGTRAGGAAPDPRRPVWSRAARLPSFVASGGTIGIVEQLYRVARVRVDSGGGETGTELHETTGIARRHDLGRRLAQPLELRGKHRARHLGLEQREQPGAAAALGGARY